MSALIEYVRAWIDKADHDLGSAKIIFLHLPDYFDTIAFHCQQATEKYIKAILVYREIEFERSHDLIYLLELLPEDLVVSEDKYKKAVVLNGFSQIRYPNRIEHMTKEELEEATVYKLCESYRLHGRVYHRIIINFGRLNELETVEQKKLLASRVEQILINAANWLG